MLAVKRRVPFGGCERKDGNAKAMRCETDALQVLMERKEDEGVPQVENHVAVPCDHCALTYPEDRIQQCWSCQGVFCGCCSVANFDERYDRAFCLDCHQAYAKKRIQAWPDAVRATTCCIRR